MSRCLSTSTTDPHRTGASDMHTSAHHPDELVGADGITFDAQTDVIVVGTGAGGYATAVTAAQNGARVIVLEKGDTIGGTTKKAAAAYWVPNNHFMRDQGLADPKP